MTSDMANIETKKAADGTVLGTYRTCGRCQGTGWWAGQILRGCFACGGQNMRIGSGRQFRENADGKAARLEAHAVEVREMIALAEARKAEKLAKGRRWLDVDAESLARDVADLARIEAEIAAVRS